MAATRARRQLPGSVARHGWRCAATFASPWRWVRSAGCFLALMCLLQAVGCASLGRGTPAMPVVRSLQDLMPHGDRDHFVYVWQRFENGQPVADGVQVEHVTAGANGEFEVSLSENGVAVGRMLLRDLADRLVLLFEEDMVRGFRISYDPPLSQIQLPLRPGRYESSASATFTGLADGATIGVAPVTQQVEIKPGSAVDSRVGRYAQSVVLGLVRTLRVPDGTEELLTETVVVPGIGETSSTGNTPETLQMHRELACAVIGGRRLGDCAGLDKAWKGRRTR